MKTIRDRAAAGRDVPLLQVGYRIQDLTIGTSIWLCEKWSEEACEWVRKKLGLAAGSPISSALLYRHVGECEMEAYAFGNLFLNEGIQQAWDLTIGAVTTNKYDNATADIGVGDSATAEAATQTDLQAASNKLFVAMVASYPQRTNQTVDFRGDFTSGQANYVWNEFSVRNGNTSNKNINRKVSSLGTKATGTWTLTASLTIA